MGEMNGLRVRTLSTSLGEWISSGNEWSQSPCHPVSGSTCPGLAIGVWCGKGTGPGCAWCLRGGHASAWFSPFWRGPAPGAQRYAGDGYRSPLWLCVSYNGSPVLVHRLRGNKIHFHQAIKDRRILIIPGIHYFDAHRLQPQLLQAPALQIHLRASHLAGPEGAGEAVEDLSSDEERATTDGESEVEAAAEDADLPPEEPWCPPIPDAPDDPTEMEIAGAADKLETMMNSSQPQANIFFQPNSLGALPSLWLQAKLTISLTSIQDKFARLFMSIAAELWLRDAIDTLEEVRQVARNFTLRLAEKLAQYICSLTRRAESLATPETECLLYATYWFRPILSELIGAATESADVNRERAPSGPVKVVVTNRPHSRRHNGTELVSGVSALLAWFPASWASKIAPCFIGEEGGSIQLPQEVAIVCPHREFEGLQRDAVDQVLQAVKFTDKNAPGLNLALDEDFQTSNCFTELIRGYTMGAVEPYTRGSRGAPFGEGTLSPLRRYLKPLPKGGRGGGGG